MYLLNKLKNILNKQSDTMLSDITPKGIKSTIKSKTHGSSEDFNKTWEHIINQRRNTNNK